LSEDGFGANGRPPRFRAAETGRQRQLRLFAGSPRSEPSGAGHVTSVLVIGPGRVAFWSIRHFAQTLSGFLGSVR
jgi:hypothetical protein